MYGRKNKQVKGHENYFWGFPALMLFLFVTGNTWVVTFPPPSGFPVPETANGFPVFSFNYFFLYVHETVCPVATPAPEPPLSTFISTLTSVFDTTSILYSTVESQPPSALFAD